MIQLLQAMFSQVTGAWHGPSTMDVRAAIHEVQEGKSINSAPSARDDGQPEDPYADGHTQARGGSRASSRKRRLHKFQVAGHITYHPEEAETC